MAPSLLQPVAPIARKLDQVTPDASALRGIVTEWPSVRRIEGTLRSWPALRWVSTAAAFGIIVLRNGSYRSFARGPRAEGLPLCFRCAKLKSDFVHDITKKASVLCDMATS